MNKMNKKGFTIVELVIVIAVIAILAGVLIPTFGGIIDKANQSKVLQQATNEYKEAYALALADGVIDAKDTDLQATNGQYKFTFGGTISAPTCTVTDAVNDGWTVSWDTTTKAIVVNETPKNPS